MSGVARKLLSASSGGVNPAWDLAYAVVDISVHTNAWNVSTATYIRGIGVVTQEANPTGVFFKPDGLKMYIIGTSGDDVNEYDLSTAWDVSSAVFLQNFSVAPQETNPADLFFKPDGLKMYILGSAGDDVNEYNLSTAWDVSTAAFLQNFSVAPQETVPTGMFFKPDGLKMYIIGTIGDDVNEYDLSTAWDVSTAVFLQDFSVTAQETVPTGMFFKPDGLKMYITGNTGDDVNEYDLGTAWDVSSAVFLQNFSVAAQESIPQGLFFRPDGIRMYIIGNTGDAVNEYSIGTQGFSVAAQETVPTGMFFKPDGLKMYIAGSIGDDVNEYDLSTAWDVNSAVFLQNFSVGTQEGNPQGLFFRPDGLKMYITGNTGDEVNEYDLSTAWDVSTASFVQLFSVAAQEANPTGVFFKPDGLKMYIIGTSGDDVNEYDLSTAWDVSTAVFLQDFSVTAQETVPTGMFFKPDGLKMYITGNTGDDVNEYDLGTAWDVSSAVFLQNFSVAAQDLVPQSLFFRPDGLKMYVVGSGGDAVYAYDFVA